MIYQAQMERYRLLVEEGLNALSFAGVPEVLQSAMRYSLLLPGKRLRPVLLLAACDMVGGDIKAALPFALAVEMIHAYSLVHDDLPALDNDTLRRGQPTNHVVYGEAMAILAGDGLLNFAYEHMARQRHPHALKALRIIADAAGVTGMIAGQVMDVTLEGTTPNADMVRYIHENKTAQMITAPVVAGLVLAGASDEQVQAGRDYGQKLGVAFQIVDDLLDLMGDEGLLGKHTGKDVQAGKLTWPAVVGAEQSEKDAAALIQGAIDAIQSFNERAEFLKTLALLMVSRVQ